MEWGKYQGEVPSFKKILPKFDNKRLRFLSEVEVNKLFFYLKPHENWHDIAMFALNTGLRRGEIFGLTKYNVNFNERLLYVVDTKTDNNRVVPLNETAFDILNKKNNLNRQDDLFFYNRAPRVFSRAIEKSGLNDGVFDNRQKVVFHTLRHTFASWLVQMGTPINIVSYLLGHTTIVMTMRYAHIDSDQARNGIDKLRSRLRTEGERAAESWRKKPFLKNPEIFNHKI